jgi:hypothetical protein
MNGSAREAGAVTGPKHFKAEPLSSDHRLEEPGAGQLAPAPANPEDSAKQKGFTFSEDHAFHTKRR